MKLGKQVVQPADIPLPGNITHLDMVPELEALARELRHAKKPSSIISRLADGVEFTARSETVQKLQSLKVKDDAEDIGGVSQTFRECLNAITACHKEAVRVVATADRGSWGPLAERMLFRQWKVVVGQVLVLSQMMQIPEFVRLAPMLLVADSKIRSSAAATLVREAGPASPELNNQANDRRTVCISLPKQAQDADVVVLNCQVEMRKNADASSRSMTPPARANVELVMGESDNQRRPFFSFWKKKWPVVSEKTPSDVPPRYDEIIAGEPSILVEKA